MKKYAKIIIALFLGAVAQGATAQIGYQVAVVDQNTGEAKANKNVSVSLTLTDNSGGVIYTQNESVTTNELGIATIQIGNGSTFSSVDWSKLPLWISATVDGVSMGKTQVLSVPVAEHANHYGQLTSEILSSKNVPMYNGDSITFNSGGTATFHDGWAGTSKNYTYEIEGNNVYVFLSASQCWMFHYSPQSGSIRFIED